ncbi:tetratricopeptide repeat protein 7B-like isoform X2 [Gigantopelta aegis]|uniref:tetratricopeptide repeat protein 7B-like isoform X2 n=1 Tax=Gigantopelta aegis TaxID=1735272 RepID=UPI001B88A65D|nr:tetratricopeptide repeat protein 7B-like isoform X2 [Gigantopelta aegis]
MASKLKITRLESEIEKHRVDANWKRAVELAKQLVQKSPDLAVLVNFIVAESKLEEYLTDNPPTEKNIIKAKRDLDEAEKLFHAVGHKETRVGLQAQLLLAKIHYCKGQYGQALQILNETPLEKTDVENASSRMLHIVAESYAIKGLCLEHTPPTTTSKFKAIEHEMQITSCFEKAGDLAIIHLQEREKTYHGGTLAGSQCQLNSNTDIGIILEQAIQESPIMYIKKGELEKGIWRFRELLRAVETRFTQGVRLTLARQLAEVLLRGVCDATYIPLNIASSRQKKRKPKHYSGDRLFCPGNRDEEALLLLLIAEAIATRETVLNRSDELTETRQQAFHNTTAVYDLLALALVKRAQFNMLSESFERAMRFSFQEFHIWNQFANSLICAGKHSRAILVLKECSRLQPQNVTVYLQAARLCYEYLHQYSDGIEWSKQAIAVVEDDPMTSRAYTSLGIGYSMRAHEAKLQAERQTLHRNALSAFQKAYDSDPYDYLACFHLSLQLANLRQISEALIYVKLALKYRNDHIHSLHLLVLLLTALKQMDDAMVLVHAALEEYPQNLSLLLTQSKLEEVMLGPEESLVTCKVMMKLWKEIHEMDSDDSSEKKEFANDRMAFDRRSLAQMTINEFSDRGSGSIRAESIAASHMERALSEVASSINSSFMPRPGSQQSWMMQAQIWSHLAELYLVLNKVSEAEACIQEMSGLLPLSHQLYFMKGRVFEHKQKYKDAKRCFENAVAINPGHTRSLQHLGVILHRMNDNKMAEKFLRDAVNNDPMSHKSWFSLGLVLDALGKTKDASECLNMATELEASSPIVAFTVIPRLMQ